MSGSVPASAAVSSEARKIRELNKMEINENDDFSMHPFVEGEGDACPTLGSKCVIAFTFLEPSSEIVSAEDMGEYKEGDECVVTIGDGDSFLPDHFDKILMSMKPGGKAYIKSKFNHKGERNAGVEASCSFKFNMIFKSFEDPFAGGDAALNRLEAAQRHKDSGTSLFKQGNIKRALIRYQRALSVLGEVGVNDTTTTDTSESSPRCSRQELYVQCHLNLAMCKLKLDSAKSKSSLALEVIEHCDKALSLEKDSLKGLYRRAQAHKKMENTKAARKDFARVVEIEPSNKAAIRELANIDKQEAEAKALYSKMF